MEADDEVVNEEDIAAVEQSQQQNVENNDEPDVIPDDNTEATNERQGRARTQVERLTYDRLGETHQQSNANNEMKAKKNVSFADSKRKELKQCHNIIKQKIDDSNKLEYNPDLAI